MVGMLAVAMTILILNFVGFLARSFEEYPNYLDLENVVIGILILVWLSFATVVAWFVGGCIIKTIISL